MTAILRLLSLSGALLALQPATQPADEQSGAPADRILRGATVILVDPPGATASAVAIRGERIAYVGTDDGAMIFKGPRTQVVDLKGHTIIPGLIDAHGHVSSLGFAMLRVDAVGTHSASEVASRVKEAAGRVKSGEWVQGRGWDQNDWERRAFPTREILDQAAPKNPVALGRIDGHALWVNSLALDAAGISRKTPDPAGGRIHRDDKGNPTGILVDNAMGLIRARIPSPDRAQTRAAILRALDRCLDAGLTGVHDAGISMEEAAIYKELAASRRLPIRVHAMLGGNSRSLSDYFAEPPVIGMGGGFLSIRAIKLGIDGALGSRGAALFEDYSDEPGNRGLVTRSAEEIRSVAVQAAAKGFQVAVHAIGDRGNALALKALEEALNAGPGGDHRFRIEHAQVLRLEEISRFKESGILPSMQPTHCTSDMPWAENRVGPGRIEGAYAWRKILRTGVPIAGGSDFPVESENPFPGLHAAITRQDASGSPPGGWYPEERMTREEALRAFTLSAAYFSFDENDLGSIKAGKRADMLILAANPLETPVSDLLEMRPVAVILDGRVVRASPPLLNGLAATPGPEASAGSR
jgi:predicted amidohydrolase YtcJ